MTYSTALVCGVGISACQANAVTNATANACWNQECHAFVLLAAGLLRYIGAMLLLPCLQVIVNQILLGLIAALGCLLGGTLLLPSLATDELREVLADIIQKCGYSISGYASRVFPPEPVSVPVTFILLCVGTPVHVHTLASKVILLGMASVA